MKKLIVVIMLLVSSVCYASTDYDLTGTWKGYLNSNLGYASVTMEIEQYEDGTFVGEWESNAGGYGTVGGKLKGRTLKLKVNNDACDRFFISGKGRLSGDGKQIRYSVSGKDCNGKKQSGKGKFYLQDENDDEDIN
jgi:hypothetical protein